ncbi:hypothetical protein [Streptomyces sp. L2]|nr:hypothetical protein [Streptomyces sp. L2]
MTQDTYKSMEKPPTLFDEPVAQPFTMWFAPVARMDGEEFLDRR